MDQQVGWKIHTFTLSVFAGIVVLCSIFFVLGMLVGRSQGQKIAAAAAEEAALEAATKRTMPAAVEDKPELTFYDSVEEDAPPPALDPVPAKPEAAPMSVAPAQAPGPVTNFQVAALSRSSDAERLLDEIRRKGFKGFILAPARGDSNPLYRVQVGPYADSVEAESQRQKLVSAGYSPIKR